MDKKQKYYLFWIPIALMVLFVFPFSGLAEISTSTSFKILDPEINTGAGRSTSASFILLHSVGFFALGTSSATSFQLNPGFLAFPTATAPSGVTADAGDASVSLSWTAGTGTNGWSVSGYNVGQSTTLGGPYSYTSVGNVTSSNRTGLSNGTTYYFVIRTEDAFGNSIATSTEVSATPVAAPTPPPSGGGGGGGIIGGLTPTVLFGKFRLRGIAYPNAQVSILLDNKLVTSIKVGSDSLFSIIVSAESGAHSVGIFSEDILGRRSLTFSFSSTVVGTAQTTVSDIIIPPTINLSAEEITPRTLNVVGSSYPEASLSLLFNSEHELVRSTSIDDEGLWEYNLDTEIIEIGDHIVRAQTILNDGGVSVFSESRTFTVLPEGILIAKKKVAICRVADFNCDGGVNLIDFSILLFNWNIPVDETTDLSGDGRIDITDFSIMLFHWTG